MHLSGLFHQPEINLCFFHLSDHMLQSFVVSLLTVPTKQLGLFHFVGFLACPDAVPLDSWVLKFFLDQSLTPGCPVPKACAASQSPVVSAQRCASILLPAFEAVWSYVVRFLFVPLRYYFDHVFRLLKCFRKITTLMNR